MSRTRLRASLAGMFTLWGGITLAEGKTPATWGDFIDVDPLAGQYESNLIQQFAPKVIFFLGGKTPALARYDIATKTMVQHRCDAVENTRLDAGIWTEASANVLTHTMSHGTNKSKMVVWWDLNADHCFIATPVAQEKTQMVKSTSISPDGRHLYYALGSANSPGGNFHTVAYYATDLSTGDVTLLHEIANPSTSWLTDYPIHGSIVEGKPTLFISAPPISASNIFKIDVESKTVELLKDTKTEGRPSALVYNEAGQRLVFQTTYGIWAMEKDGTTTKLSSRTEMFLSPDRTRFCVQNSSAADIIDVATLAVLMTFGDRNACKDVFKTYNGTPDLTTFAYWTKETYPYRRTLSFCDVTTAACKKMEVDEEKNNDIIDHYVVRPKQGQVMYMNFEVRNHHLFGLVEKRGGTREVIADLEYDLQTDEVFRLDGTGSRLFLHGDGVLKMLPL